MADYVGQSFGNYHLLRMLGRGGFAEVYLGEHMRLGTKAAVKILHTNLGIEETAAFQREARVIANLVHPSIVRVLDFDVQDGIPFLVLDYAPNGSLREKHPRGVPVPLNLVAQYVRQVSSALQYAHEYRLIHRDIKPENMFVGRQGEILLGDFGIASIAHSTSSMSIQASMGTLPYMAPEQIQGQPRPASDQYALAVTVYQWISGQLPFQGSSSEIIAQHLAIAPSPLRSKVPTVPEEVDRVVMTALAKDARERFGSVQAFATAFAQACKVDVEEIRESVSGALPLPPTLPIERPVLVKAATPPPQSAAPVRTPPLAAAMWTPPIGSSSYPRPLRRSAPPEKMNPWLVWLLGTLIILVVGGIALKVIPTLIVYGPHGSANNSSSNSDSGSSNSVDFPYATPTPLTAHCHVGTSYDTKSGLLTDQDKDFLLYSAIYLACILPASNNYLIAPDAINESIMNPQGNIYYPAASERNGQIDVSHHTFYDFTFAITPGWYTWNIYSSLAVLNLQGAAGFHVTSKSG